MPPLEWLARTGYVARAFVFFILSYFTLLAAIDAHTRPLDSKDALGRVLAQPLGTLLLSCLAAGLLCFAAWRGLQSYLDPDGCGSDLKGLSRRAVYAGAGLFYFAFATVVISMIFGSAGEDSERTLRDWTAWALTKPAGRWIVGIAGIAVVVTGLGICAGGLRAEIQNLLTLKKKPRMIVTALGLIGSLTRGLVFTIIGAFLIFAALDSNAHEAAGLAGALSAIKGQSYGTLLLGATALGFLSFGLFGLAEAAFRRIDTDCAAGQPSWHRA
jgi:hypothetical protein